MRHGAADGMRNFLETEVPLAAHDNMIQHAQAEEFGGRGQPFVRAQVGRAGLDVAGGVVVAEDRGRRYSGRSLRVFMQPSF